MPEDLKTLLDEALEAWGFAREGVIAEIRNLSEKDMAFRPAGESRSTGELVAELKRAHEQGSEKIRKAGEIHMLQHIRRFDGLLGTRLAWMHHGVGHEEYHRGQIALYARLSGKTPALTKLIEGSS